MLLDGASLKMHVVLVAGDQEAAYACGLLALELETIGASCLLVRPPLPTRSHPPCEAVEAVSELLCTPEQLLCHTFLMKAEAIGVFLSGKGLENFVSSYRQICRLEGRKPAPVFSGPMFPLGEDALVADLLPRLGCDLVCVHGERQLSQYADLTRHWAHPVPEAIGMGFWFMPNKLHKGGQLNLYGAPPAHTLVVLAQEGIPSLVGSQARMLRQLVELAKTSPEWIVLIQRDHTVESDKPWLSIKQGRPKVLPNNLAIGAVGNLPTILSHCTACLTLSSPWVLTAMAWGRPCMIMGDHGIRTEDGTSLFFGSGVMGRLDDIGHLDALLEQPLHLNQEWLHALGWAVEDGPQRLLRKLKELSNL